MRPALVAALAVAVALAAACDGEPKARGGDDALRGGLEETLASPGFHIEGAFRLPEETFELNGDYVAPDRVKIESSGSDGHSVSIYIGSDAYFSEPDDADRFTRSQLPCGAAVHTVIPALGLVRGAEDVRTDGDRFTFVARDNDGAPVDGEARIADGYLVELGLRYRLPRLGDAVEERWVFSDFGRVVSIEPPTPDRIVDEPDAGGPVVIVDEGEPAACD